MNYKNSRDAAWQILSKNKISSLPISVEKICKAERIRLVTYAEGEETIRKLGLEGHTVGNDAFSLAGIVFYDDTKPPARQRFSVAHEIGHIVLHDTDGATVLNREMSPNDDPLEHEANIFASRLLAPMCVLHFLGLNSPEEISEVCHISMTAAQIRYQRLCELRERDASFRLTKGYGCFLLSPLERKVYRQFEKYIEKNRR